MQAQGLAVDADVLSAAAQLSSAKSQLESIDAELTRYIRPSCYYTGWEKGADTVIGPVPAADPSVIGTPGFGIRQGNRGKQQLQPDQHAERFRGRDERLPGPNHQRNDAEGQ